LYLGFPKLGSIFGEHHLDGCMPFVNAGELRHPLDLPRRPSFRSAAAPNIDIAASGFVPTAVLDGGAADLCLDKGDRDGPDCFLHLSARSPPHILGTRVLFSISFGVLCYNVHLHCLDINISFQTLRSSSCSKKKTHQATSHQQPTTVCNPNIVVES
jgi:hypothetical protein